MTAAKRIFRAVVLLAGLAPSPSRAADPIRIYAAGSLGAVLPVLIAQSGLPPGIVAPVFGPAGALGQRLRGGEAADLFASADMAQPRAVVADRPGALVIPFARNRMCLLTPGAPGLSADTLLDRILDPAFRIAASTPGADPGGDYALAVYARADIVRPGAGPALNAKSLRLLGGPGSMVPQPGHSPAASILLARAADGLLYYCSAADAAAQEMPGLVSIKLPDSLDPGPIYGLAVLLDRPEAARLALFMLSDRGQAILAGAGLLPVVP